MEPEDPPPKNYGFKEREYKRDNAVGSAATPKPTAKELAVMAGPVARSVPKAAAGPKVDDPNDVYAVLKENRAAAQRDGADAVVIKKIRSRRKRDFWLLLVGGNLLVIALTALSGFNPVSMIFGLAGLVLISLGLTWIMWFIMDDY